jgi:hypothetical protein
MERLLLMVIMSVLAAFAVASCDKLKPPPRLPLPKASPGPPAEQVPSPKQQAPGASGVAVSSVLTGCTPGPARRSSVVRRCEHPA